MDTIFALVILAGLFVIVFDFTNGFHDASNLVASVIAARAMTPRQSVIVVGVCVFLGPILGGTAVANTIGKFVTLEDVPSSVSLLVVFSGLASAVIWNLLTWWRGIPSSSSHALVGGLAGAVLVSVGPEHVVWGFEQLAHGHFTGVTKVLLALFLSPLAGFWVGFLLQRLTAILLRGRSPLVNKYLRQTQWLSTAGLAFSHGANEFVVPLWVAVLCASAITLGTAMGGWRIVRTLAFAIYKIRPLHAMNSQLTSASVIMGAALIGAPVSTTHIVSSSITGIGAAERPRAVRWAKAKDIALTWLITIPGAGLVASIIITLMNLLGFV